MYEIIEVESGKVVEVCYSIYRFSVIQRWEKETGKEYDCEFIYDEAQELAGGAVNR